MSQVTATIDQAAHWAGGASVPPARWNPVYRALVDAPAPAPGEAPAEETVELMRRQLTAPALLTVAVTTGGSTHRLRIGVDPATSTLERSEGDQPSQWSESAAQELPALITDLLERAGVDLSPARLDVRRSSDALSLSPQQAAAAREGLARGLTPEQAFAAVPGLDDSLRDALTATGPRISLALTLHDPQGRQIERPVSWSRLWASGRKGLYRLDQPDGPELAVHPVEGGDVLGTVLPILEQALRFAAGATVAGGAR